MWVDLHVHTSFSDGTLTPREVVREARAKGLSALAITDHDTLDGLEEAKRAGELFGIMVIPGVEISVDLGEGRSSHLLGYGLDGKWNSFGDFLGKMRLSRVERNRAILEKLRSLGLALDPKEITDEADEARIGRPHIAQAMVRKGYVRSVDEAFARYLARGAKAYIPRRRPSCTEAMEAIREAGGVPVLAHPHTVGIEGLAELEMCIGKLVREGLAGVEVLYPDAPFAIRKFLSDLCERWGLLKTGGSDFHGGLKPEVHLGFGRGDLRVPLEWARLLKEAMEKAKEFKS
jgi:predicted metal-dependent phosphoesterase TrpH